MSRIRSAIRSVLYALRLRRRPSYRETILRTPGLVGYWPLDGDTRDASGHGHDGVYIHPAVTEIRVLPGVALSPKAVEHLFRSDDRPDTDPTDEVGR